MEKNRIQRRTTRMRKRLKEAALDIFSEKSVHAVTVEEIKKSLKPLRRVFVKRLVTFLGR